MQHDDQAPTPRINRKLLTLHKGGIVRLVGEVKQNQNGHMVVAASDKGDIFVQTSQASSDLAPGTIVEIIGTVNSDLSISEISNTVFPDTFNLDNYDQLVNFAAQMPELFAQTV